MKVTLGTVIINTAFSKVLCDKLFDDTKKAGVRLCLSRNGAYFVHVVYGEIEDPKHGGYVKPEIEHSTLSLLFSSDINWYLNDDKSNAVALVEPSMEASLNKLGFPLNCINQAMASVKPLSNIEHDVANSISKLVSNNRNHEDKTNHSNRISWHESLFVRITVVLVIRIAIWMFRYEKISSYNHKNRIT